MFLFADERAIKEGFLLTFPVRPKIKITGRNQYFGALTESCVNRPEREGVSGGSDRFCGFARCALFCPDSFYCPNSSILLVVAIPFSCLFMPVASCASRSASVRFCRYSAFSISLAFSLHGLENVGSVVGVCPVDVNFCLLSYFGIRTSSERSLGQKSWCFCLSIVDVLRNGSHSSRVS